jgi:hypothetical protein
MSGRHQSSSVPRGRRALFSAVAAVTVAGLGALTLAFAPTASASTTTKAQLSLSGVATQSSPTGGSTVGIHPGDSVSFTASSAPTAGLDALGLSDLVSGVLNLLATYQVQVDFSGLPGGAKNTVLRGNTAKTFTFPKVGTYNFTWSAQSVGLLGVVPINLDGNQLKQAGIALNASNQYVGKIVVATDPPKGGISVQLPSVKVAPSLPVVGQLPTVSAPGIQAPTLSVSVPNLNPSKPSRGSSAPSSGSKGGSTASKPATVTNDVPVPDRVVPNGDGNSVYGSTGGYGTDSGYYPGALGDTTSKLTTGSGGSAVSKSGSATTNTKAKPKTVELASSRPSSGQLPVILAIVAMIALVLVAGTYARLFLIKRQL